MKKVLALILALVLCVGVLAACDNTPAGTTPPDTKDTTPVQDDTTAPVVEEWSFEGKTLDIIAGLDITDQPLEGFIEDTLGVELQFTPYSDQVVLSALTDKVTPSLIWGYGKSFADQYGRYGALVNLYDYYDLMPNFFARYESFGDKIKADTETGEGELYYAPVFLNGDVQHYAWIYRQDIFEELELEVPTNLEELMDVCAALKAAYPDSYPLTWRFMSDCSFLDELAQQFGVEHYSINPALDRETNTFYNPWTTDEARFLVETIREMFELGYIDVASLGNDTSMWVADMSTGKSFITHDKAFQLGTLEAAGQEQDENFTLSWFNNIPLVESDLPYSTRASKDYNYGWYITTRCEDIEAAVRYLDWLYSDEGSEILSWGIEGESFGVDENGYKYFLEGYDKTNQARFQLSGWIDMRATAATYSLKTQDMIIDTHAAAIEGDFWAVPGLPYTDDERSFRATYLVEWGNVKKAYYQKFFLGELEINDENWQKMTDELAATYEADLLKIYTDAYARYLEAQ